MLSWLENLYVLKKHSFSFSSNFIWQLLLKIEHLYSIKSFLKFVYSREHLQYLYLIPPVSHFYHSVKVYIWFYEFFQKYYWQDLILRYHMVPGALLLITSFFLKKKLIIFIACSLTNSQNFFIQSLALYICLFSMLLKEDIVDIERPDGICLLTIVVDHFLGLVSHPSISLLYTQDLHK